MTVEKKASQIEEILESIMRGAAKILGCNSANLIVINEKTREIRIRVGVMAEQYNIVNEVEEIFGGPFDATAFHFGDADDCLVFASWHDRAVYETSSLAELVGTVFPTEIVEQVSGMIGEHRFICVPVISGSRIFGNIIFEKVGRHPFSPQQREILLRYARRIGEIIENDLMAFGLSAIYEESPKRDMSVQDQLLHIALGESAPAVLVDPEFRITSVNDATEHLFGYSAEDLPGKDIGFLFREPQDIHTILNHQFLFVSNGYYEETTAIRRKDGSAIPCKVEALLLAGEANQVIGFLVLIRERRPAADLSGDGNGIARLMRRERLATMGEMAGQLAHEIRNPLLAIGATLESLIENLKLEGEGAETLSDLIKEISRLDMILKDYLSLAARHNMSIARVDLAEVLEDIGHLLRGTRKQSGKRISMHVPAGLTVLADYEGLKHVFFNLVLNALEASPKGGEVRCRATTTEKEITIFIEDSGPGLSVSADECFQPFFTTKKNGTGLGLTVCLKIVSAHGGTLTLQNRDEGGCRACVVLPRKVLQ